MNLSTPLSLYIDLLMRIGLGAVGITAPTGYDLLGSPNVRNMITACLHVSPELTRKVVDSVVMLSRKRNEKVAHDSRYAKHA